jgi:predicted ATPase
VAQNLPQYSMPIIGRDREIATVSAALQRSRIVSIVGAGGIGKTRLGVEVATALTAEQRDGTWFVDLAPLVDPLLVPHAIAAAVGVELSPTDDFAEALLAAMRQQQLLLVLDNCEHVLTMAGEVIEALVEACPNLRVLATSREPLGIDAEKIIRLGTLDEEAAMELFSEYACQADPQFSPSGRNLPVLRDICKRLDGIALAIVLAAANVRLMPLGQIRARLDGRLRLLKAGSRAIMLPRHQTMQALLDWSYDLLDERERRIFRKLGVFRGSFGRLAAQRAVAAESPEDTAAVLDALVDKSMLLREADDRYRMLEAIRQYAIEHLQAAGEESEARRAHAKFFAELSQWTATAFGEGSEEKWLSATTPELDNFRAALDWSRDRDTYLAGMLAANLSDFWEFNNLAGEGLRRSEVILATLESPNEPHAIEVLLAVSRLALAARIYRRSFETSERARILAERAKNEPALAEARRLSGRSRYLLGIDPERSLSDLHDALDIIRAQGRPFFTARAQRDYASALAQKHHDEGLRLLLDALKMAEGLDWPRLTMHLQINVAEREFRSGDVESAVERSRGVIEMLRRRRYPLQLGHALSNLAAYLSVKGEDDEALAVAREAISIGRTYDLQDDVAIPMQSLALVLARSDQPYRAARLLGYVDAFYERFGMKRELTEAIVQRELLAVLERSLGDHALGLEIATGRSMNDESAVVLALDEEDGWIAQQS